MTPFSAIACAAGFAVLGLGYLLAKRLNRPSVGVTGVIAGFLLVLVGTTAMYVNVRQDAVAHAWKAVTTTYAIATPKAALPPSSPDDAPVALTGRVNGAPAACQAFHTGHAVKVTCNGTEADRR